MRNELEVIGSSLVLGRLALLLALLVLPVLLGQAALVVEVGHDELS